MKRFKLSDSFIEFYSEKQPDWGFGELGYFTYKRTYARPIYDDNGNILRSEEWYETIRRVVEGSFTYQKQHCDYLGIPWDNKKAQSSAQTMYDKMFNFKFLPAGRGLWMAGTPFVEERESMGLFSCGFTTTENIDIKDTLPFEWSKNSLMLGTGVGFDLLGTEKIEIKQPADVNPWTKKEVIFVVPDTREGWVEALKLKLQAYFDGKSDPMYDFSQIRGPGIPIKGFGGISSGPGPLVSLLDDVDNLLSHKIGESLGTAEIFDIFCFIAKAVVSGNVRRSALLALGSIDDEVYLNLKNPSLFQKELNYSRWAANISIDAKVGQTDYLKILPGIIANGEPGIVWLDNFKSFGRTGDGKKDHKIQGVNPCFSGDTLIAVADGRDAVSIRDLAQEGKDVSVYSVDRVSGLVEIKWGRNPRLTRKDANLVEITLDDDTKLVVTPDHGMLLKDYSKLEAKDLKIGDDTPGFVHSPNEIKLRKVKNIKFLDYIEDVYNLTVDDNHTVGIITASDEDNKSTTGIFTLQCSEIGLESAETCNLCELFPSRHDSIEELKETSKYAYLYAKSITLLNTKSPETNAVMLKNRRIGLSMSGIIDSFVKFGRRNFLKALDEIYTIVENYDEIYSDWLGIPKSKKKTTCKPSGSISLLSNVSPGIHYPHSEYYIRRIRVVEDSHLIPKVKEAGYFVEQDKYSPKTMVVEFPIHSENFIKGKEEASIWEQMNNAADIQRYWSDNAVSITVTFKESEEKDIVPALEIFEDKLKAVSISKTEYRGL